MEREGGKRMKRKLIASADCQIIKNWHAFFHNF